MIYELFIESKVVKTVNYIQLLMDDLELHQVYSLQQVTSTTYIHTSNCG